MSDIGDQESLLGSEKKIIIIEARNYDKIEEPPPNFLPWFFTTEVWDLLEGKYKHGK